MGPPHGQVLGEVLRSLPQLEELDISDNDGMGDDCAVVIPREASVAAPYAISLVKNGPNPEQGKKLLDFVLSDEGQSHWANAYLRPVFSAAMSADVKKRFLPEAEYQRAQAIDVQKLSVASKAIGRH